LNPKPRVVVCGTTFGQVYLEAMAAADMPVELAGILARGSDRSHFCAEHYHVPLFTRVEDLPGDIEIATVVVRSSLLGGGGTELARRLLARGIHVLQEHPLHHDELAECIRQARARRVHYRLNSFYPYLPPVERFLGASQEILRKRLPLYVDAACSFQVAYALLDILRLALGKIRPWGFSATRLSEDIRRQCAGAPPFQSLDGVFAGVPLSLRVQNQLDPDDPDDPAHLLHRITIGTEAGDLTLVSTHGPLVWCARPEIPKEIRDPALRRVFALATDGGDRCTALLGNVEGGGQQDLFRSLWPEAVRRAMKDFHRVILEGEESLRHNQGHLTLCRVWQELSAELGPPQLVRPHASPRRLSAEEWAGLKAAAGGSAAAQR
jgi:thiazolinyl imide reductase